MNEINNQVAPGFEWVECNDPVRFDDNKRGAKSYRLRATRDMSVGGNVLFSKRSDIAHLCGNDYGFLLSSKCLLGRWDFTELVGTLDDDEAKALVEVEVRKKIYELANGYAKILGEFEEFMMGGSQNVVLQIQNYCGSTKSDCKEAEDNDEGRSY